MYTRFISDRINKLPEVFYHLMLVAAPSDSIARMISQHFVLAAKHTNCFSHNFIPREIIALSELENFSEQSILVLDAPTAFSQ